MSMLIVADVGNSRIKWGRCDEQRVLEAASLPLDNASAWVNQRTQWADPARWVVAGVNPPAIERLVRWLKSRGEAVETLTSFQMLPIRTVVDHPERVGLDRLLNAVAAASRDRAGRPAILVDAGSAITVDWLDQENVFRGGAIFPGPRLMAESLRHYTAKLPFVEIADFAPPMPGASTTSAIAAGVSAAAIGGIRHLVERLVEEIPLPPIVYLTGGEAERLAPALRSFMKRLNLEIEIWPFMTLEGIRISAARQP